MAISKARTTPGINQPTVGKAYKNTSNTSSYFGNIGKEFKDVVKTYNATGEMSNKSGPGTDAEANRLRNQIDKELGQFFGSLIGKRYNNNGKRIK